MDFLSGEQMKEKNGKIRFEGGYVKEPIKPIEDVGFMLYPWQIEILRTFIERNSYKVVFFENFRYKGFILDYLRKILKSDKT
jgi:hypothetical protein